MTIVIIDDNRVVVWVANGHFYTANTRNNTVGHETSSLRSFCQCFIWIGDELESRIVVNKFIASLVVPYFNPIFGRLSISCGLHFAKTYIFEKEISNLSI